MKIGDTITVIYRYWGQRGQAAQNLRTGTLNKIMPLDNGHFNIQIKVLGMFNFWHFIDGKSNKVTLHGPKQPSLNKLKNLFTEKPIPFDIG